MEHLQLIQNKIYEIRGKRVMLDFDLAQLYEVTTSALNQAVKRNLKRFPIDFMFQLTPEEYTNLKSQFVTSSWGGTRKLPNAFTEQGVAMLSGLLSSDRAIAVNIGIMRTFVAMREHLTNSNLQSAEIRELRAKIEALELSGEETLRDVNDLSEDLRKDIDNIYSAIAELSIKLPTLSEPRNPIGYTIDRSKK